MIEKPHSQNDFTNFNYQFFCPVFEVTVSSKKLNTSFRVTYIQHHIGSSNTQGSQLFTIMSLDRMNISGWVARACGCRAGGLEIESRPMQTQKNFYGRRGASDYVIFRRAVKRQPFHIHDTKPRTTQQHSSRTPYTLELDQGLFPPDIARSFLPEKKVSSYKLHMNPSMVIYHGINHWVANGG